MFGLRCQVPKLRKIMKSPVFSIFILLCVSFAYAQSGNTRFIDSPSWVLAKEKTASPVTVPGKQEKNDPGKTKPGAGGGPQVNPKKTQDPPPKKPAEPAASKSQKSIPSSTPRQEGFLHIGIYATPVINWLSSINKPYSRSGVNACVTPTVMLDMRMVGRLYLGVGVALNTFGGRLQLTEIDKVKHKRSYSFTYLEIPLRVKWQTRNFSNSRGSIFFSGGLNLGFGLSYKYKDIYKGPINIGGHVMDGVFRYKGREVKENRRLANVAGVLQFGYNYQVARRTNLIIGVEYHYGFVRPIKAKKFYYTMDKPSYNNQQVGLLLGVMF